MHFEVSHITMEMLSRSNTQALKGVAIIAIVVFHILWRFDISPLLNLWGAPFVTVFLVLSGYGLEESFRRNGLESFWLKRLTKVVLPFVFFVCAYNYLFPFFPLGDKFSAEEAMHRCLDELIYSGPKFWFVFFILKCYAVYWIGTRFLSGRLRLLFFFVCAFICLNLRTSCGHLEAEQSFSFLTGVLLSMYKDRVEALSHKEIGRWTFLLLFVAAAFFCLKAIPQLHELKGTVAYNYLLCPFRLSLGLAYIPLFSMLRLGRSGFVRLAGNYSFEIYIAHMPFIGLITDVRSIAIFLACSALSLAILLIYRRFFESRLTVTEALFIIVNVLFVAKYSARVSETASLCATLLAIAFYYVLLRLVLPYIYIYRRVAFCVCLLGFVGMIVLQYSIDPYSVQVDRWSALHFPIQNLLDGIYPYTASTHLGGNASPFPVWQLLHVPFYLLGNVGLSFFAAVILFLWSCWKVRGRDKTLIVSLLLCLSVAVWYEVLVRSDLITNMLLVASIFNLFSRNPSQQRIERHRWWIACMVGLLASTRVIVLIPITVLLLPYFVKMNWRNQLGVSLLAIIVFALTFVPFAIWDWQEFYYFQNNPWRLQTSQGNLSDFLLFVPLTVFLAMTHKGIAFRYCRNSALMLMMFVVVTFVHNMYLSENFDLFSSAYDITYLSTALPFCMLGIAEKDDI